MPDTIPDIKLSGSTYQSVYALSGIGKGVEIFIQNKNNTAIYLQISSTQPASTSRDGYILAAGLDCVVKGEISDVWAFGTSRLCVQVLK